jgi:O-antigen biosynthesis protein
MKLSIIIVNYNVKHFLKQCLLSVVKATKNLEVEIFVIDNNSIDSSVEMVQTEFPNVNIIANKENTGFSKANNQAMELSSGEYVLLLNPDTIVEEDTFSLCLNFMDKHSDAGGLGVKMIDGEGRFLPESKRGLPTPSVAFYKIFGFSALFPKSKIFAKYHLGFLSKEKNHEIEILSGAFMMMRKKVLDKIGFLDENFFMYGEDIDLSYRILLAGYKNYYFSDTSIIHYKGESTKKSSVNYVFVFYNAMIIFAKKHFSEKNAKLFSFFINIAIYLRASLAVLNRLIKKSSLATFDFILLASCIYYISILYQDYTNIIFPPKLLLFAIPLYTLSWILSCSLLGGYDKPYKISRLISSTFVGSIIILVIYALLPKDSQFSRSIILISTPLAFCIFFFNRLVYHIVGWASIKRFKRTKKSFALIGSKNQADKIKQLLEETASINSFYFVNPGGLDNDDYDADINQVNDLVFLKKIDEIIFCAKDVSAQDIIGIMSSLSNNHKLNFKISQADTHLLIGSNTIQSNKDLFMLDLNNISKNSNIRLKRSIDIFSSLVLLISFPLTFFLYKNPFIALKNTISVFIGLKTWVGFTPIDNNQQLPNIKKSILHVSQGIKPINDDVASKLNIIYAKDYSFIYDLKVLLKNIKIIG